ncbi:MAG: hypothetical protein ACKO9I_16495 [Sphaerospermopsis kisseleviana]|nr:hypothetical protein [Sphaerospermopsis sp. FACHB-1194]
MVIGNWALGKFIFPVTSHQSPVTSTLVLSATRYQFSGAFWQG